MDNVIETLENCRFCLMCRHVAPVGHYTNQEALTPHGVALVVTSQKRGLIEWNEETVGVVFSEVDGGNSRAHCVNSQPFEEATAAARAELVAQGLASPAVSQTIERIKEYETPYAEETPRPSTGTGDVALFVGDAAPYLRPETLEAAVTLLRAGNVEPVLIGYGRSSGFIPQSIGDPDTARALAKKNIAELEASGASTLVVLSAGDYYVWETMLPERLGLERPSNIELIELTAYLAQQDLSFQPLDEGAYAYVDPTHAVRVPGRHEPVREFVAAVTPAPLHELFFRKERAHPVGGTHLQFSDPKLAERLTHGRLQDAQESGAQILICDDPATVYQLGRFANQYGLEVKGLYELLARQFR